MVSYNFSNSILNHKKESLCKCLKVILDRFSVASGMPTECPSRIRGEFKSDISTRITKEVCDESKITIILKFSGYR